MTSQTAERIDVHEQLRPSLEERQEPGASELCELVERLLSHTPRYKRPERLANPISRGNFLKE